MGTGAGRRVCWWWLAGLAACSQVAPVGPFRLPVQTSNNTIEFKTLLSETRGSDLVLFDAAAGRTWATGASQPSDYDVTVPYVFNGPGNPMVLQVSDGVLQDETNRPYKTTPIPSLDPGADALLRVTLSSAGDSRVLVSSGGNLLTEAAEAQPALTDTPGPLFLLDSVTGTGLWLPAGSSTPQSWQDSASTLVPPDPSMPIPCAAPLIATIRSSGPVTVTVPAGTFQAVQVTEIVDLCQQSNAPSLLVYEMDRWYAQGVGPVQLAYTDANSVVHEYQLASDDLVTNDGSWWPLGEHNSWSYQLLDQKGVPVGAPVQVQVTAVTQVKQD